MYEFIIIIIIIIINSVVVNCYLIDVTSSVTFKLLLYFKLNIINMKIIKILEFCWLKNIQDLLWMN